MGKARYDERQHRKAVVRAAAEQQARRSMLIRRGVAAASIVITVAVAYSFYRNSRLLERVTTAHYSAGQHVAGSIAYREKPPLGGLHNVVWQTCGVYDAPIHNEHAVHSLEHGAIWITYRPGLAPEELATLKALAGDDFMLLSPYPELGHAIVASAWNHQLTLDRADDPSLSAFIAEYKNNPETTPEFGASCLGGTRALASEDSLTIVPRQMRR